MNIYDFEVKDIEGHSLSLKRFEGQVLLIVNVASRCGFTPQYAGLEALHSKYQAQGFQVLGFPCNQFANQEPGDANEIRKFCELNFKVNFPLFEKIKVNGPDTHALYQYLKSQAKGFLGTELVKWNFTKFLVNRRGEVVERYAPNATPESMEQDIQQLLQEPMVASSNSSSA